SHLLLPPGLPDDAGVAAEGPRQDGGLGLDRRAEGRPRRGEGSVADRHGPHVLPRRDVRAGRRRELARDPEGAQGPHGPQVPAQRPDGARARALRRPGVPREDQYLLRRDGGPGDVSALDRHDDLRELVGDRSGSGEARGGAMTIEFTSLARVELELQHEIEQFLYHEAALLAEREYRDWLDLF